MFISPSVLGFSIPRVMSSVNRDCFLSYFANWMPMISFSYLIALVRISNIEYQYSTILNSSDERGHH